MIRPDNGLSSLCRDPLLPDGIASTLGFLQELLNPIGKDRALFIHGILQITYQMGMTELMGSCRCVVLGTPAIMDEHALILLRKMLFDDGVSAPLIHHIIGSQRRLPDPLPERFPPNVGSRFI